MGGAGSLRALAITSLVSALATGAPPAWADEVVRVSGTGTALGALSRLGAAFEQAHPGHRLQVMPSVGSSGAVKAVAHGALDLGIAARDLKPEEAALGVRALPFARTPFLFAVGPGVDAGSMDASELAALYRGDRTTWPNGQRVRLVLRPAADVDTALIKAISPEVAAALDVALAREGMIMGATNQECHDLLRRTPGALAPSSLTQVVTDDHPPHTLAWQGVPPTLAALRSGKYPLAKPLFLIVSRSPSPASLDFLRFLRGAAARRVLEETGNLPVDLASE